MKKLFAIVLGIVFAISVIGCSTELTTGSDLDLVESDEQVLALQAISSSMLLSYSNETVDQMTEDTSDVLGEDEINELDYYIEMVEAFLGNNQLQVETETSDLEEYEVMVIYRTYNLQQEEVVYKLYYNVYDLDDEEVTTETPVTTEEPATTEEPTTEAPTTTETPETTEPSTAPETTSVTELAGRIEDREDFIFHDEDDEYLVQGLEGLLMVGETTYEIEGKVLEVEGRQILRVRSYIDEDNFVLVNYQNDETEVDKQKFFFQLVEAGQVISRSRVMLIENDQVQHVQLEFINGENYERYRFHMREEDNVTYIHIDYRIETEALNDRGHIRLTKTVDEETGEVTYSYSVIPERGGRNPEFDKPHRPGPFNDRERPHQSTHM